MEKGSVRRVLLQRGVAIPFANEEEEDGDVIIIAPPPLDETPLDRSTEGNVFRGAYLLDDDPVKRRLDFSESSQFSEDEKSLNKTPEK